MKNTSLLYSAIVLFLIGFYGCSELKNDKVPTQPAVSVHGVGFKDPSSPNFHAVYIKSKNYDTQACKHCHGEDYSGGIANQSCLTCHNKVNGPENCTTCHGSVNPAPPKDLSGNVSPSVRTVGAHQVHLLGGTYAKIIPCAECHKVPTSIFSVGHIDSVAGAEVRFDTTSIFYKSNATYSNGTCANTYCHGNFNGGNNTTMTWNDTTDAAAGCGTCHGDATKSTLKEKAFPKTGHTSALVTSDCSTCHRAVVDANLTIINTSRHINGRID